ncbi:biotin transporter BioY [Methanoregula sp.]|uniref:biotin transporter BioY n=1 Tax=Methanoregula sp. TaxID=2052170 RepID=UPI000CA96A95|nr:biotin transporter BioY [Methanoregula sp.]PKG33010.1 MAG: biotin transporter BioY [Methanoregula sp.]
MFGDLERSRALAYSAVFIGLIALGSWISIPFIPVPFTLQTLFVLLAGAVMKRRAVLPVAAYVILGTLGLPIFHNGMSGPGVLLGPTGGYLAGFLVSALIVGLAYEHSSRPFRIAGLAIGTAVTLLFGMAWLMISAGMGFFPAFVAGVLPFIPGGILKAVVVYIIAERLQ